MTDLPRFHKGQLGPLDFQTLNEVMRRLDALRPLIETASVEGKATNGTMPDALVVYAEQTHPEEYPGRFAWNQVIVRGEYTTSIPVDDEPDTIATQADDDWPDIEENAQFRRGYVVVEEEGKEGATEEVEADTYAICLDPTFESGYAVLFPIRRTDAKRCYMLVPIVAGEVGSVGTTVNLFRIDEVLNESTLSGEDGGSIRAIRYRGRVIGINSTGTGYTASTSEYVLLDFGQSPNRDINKPTVVPTGALLSIRTLDPGTIVLARRIVDTGIYVSSTLAHFDVDCG